MKFSYRCRPTGENETGLPHQVGLADSPNSWAFASRWHR